MAVNPPRLQILRIDRKGMINDIICDITVLMSFVQKILADSDCHRICDDTKHAKTNQIIVYQFGILELIRKCSMLTLIKLAQTTQNS